MIPVIDPVGRPENRFCLLDKEAMILVPAGEMPDQEPVCSSLFRDGSSLDRGIGLNPIAIFRRLGEGAGVPL